jgi:hypothetical protein
MLPSLEKMAMMQKNDWKGFIGEWLIGMLE